MVRHGLIAASEDMLDAVRRVYDAVDAVLACDLDGRNPIAMLEDARDELGDLLNDPQRPGGRRRPRARQMRSCTGKKD